MSTAGEVQPATHREIAGLAVPATLALAADPLLSLVDTALVGRLGAVPLAALGINAAVFVAVVALFNFLTYGTTAQVAQLRGAARPEQAAAYAVQALWLAVACGLAVTLALQATAPWVVSAMGAGETVREPATDYLRVRALSVVSVLVIQVGHGAFRGMKDTRTPLVITAATNAVNGGLSWLLIYPAGLGVVGAAWGTVVAQTGGAAAFLWLGRRLAPTSLRIEPAAMRRIAVISRDLFLRTASLLLGMLLATSVAARMGVTTVAAHQVARELWMMLALVLDGVAIAAQALIATALGAGRAAVARTDARRLTVYGLVVGTIIGVGYYTLGGVLPRVFTTDAEVLAEVGQVWWIVAALQPVGGVVFALDGVLMGAGDFRFLRWSTALAAIGVLAPLSALALLAGWGLTGVWWAMAAMMLVRLVATVARLRSTAWSHVHPR